MRHRLLRERFEKMTDRLSGGAEGVTEEQVIRLMAAAAMLLCRHQVDRRGRCRFCRSGRWTGRFRRRRPRCMVHGFLGFAMDQSMDVVWWQLFEALDRHLSLGQVRLWLAERERGPVPPRR